MKRKAKASGIFGRCFVCNTLQTLKEINGIISESDDNIIIRCSQKNIRFEFDNVIFTSRLLKVILSIIKDYSARWQNKGKSRFKSITEAVDRASVIITSEVNKAPLPVCFKRYDKITCETSSGKVEEIVPVEMSGDDIEIGFNNKYLLEAFKNAEGEQVYLILPDR